jgi:hypothetical protein
MWPRTAAPSKETLIVIHESIILARRHHDSFEDPLTTAAAIDRVVHHSRIIEFGPDMVSVRAEQAAQHQQQMADGDQKTEPVPA